MIDQPIADLAPSPAALITKRMGLGEAAARRKRMELRGGAVEIDA